MIVESDGDYSGGGTQSSLLQQQRGTLRRAGARRQLELQGWRGRERSWAEHERKLLGQRAEYDLRARKREEITLSKRRVCLVAPVLVIMCDIWNSGQVTKASVPQFPHL